MNPLAAAASSALPTWAYILVGLAVVLGPVLTALVLLRKAPAETRKITVDTVDVNVKVAGELRDDAVESWRTAKGQLAELRTEFDQFKKDATGQMSQLSVQLRGKVAENHRLTEALEVSEARLAERDAAIADRDERIGHLETEVRDLKAAVARLENGNPGPHT